MAVKQCWIFNCYIIFYKSSSSECDQNVCLHQSFVTDCTPSFNKRATGRSCRQPRTKVPCISDQTKAQWSVHEYTRKHKFISIQG